MSKSSPTHEKIRQTALSLLKDRTEGVRQSDFWKVVEAEMSTKYYLGEATVRNALWDIDTRYPEFVAKVKQSPRDVYLYPKKELCISDVENQHSLVEDEEQSFDEESEKYEFREISAQGDYHKMLGKLLVLRVEMENEMWAAQLELVKCGVEFLSESQLELFYDINQIYKSVERIQDNCRREITRYRSGR